MANVNLPWVDEDFADTFRAVVHAPTHDERAKAAATLVWCVQQRGDAALRDEINLLTQALDRYRRANQELYTAAAEAAVKAAGRRWRWRRRS